MSGKLYLIVPGIDESQNDFQQWTNAARNWIVANCPDADAVTFNYNVSSFEALLGGDRDLASKLNLEVVEAQNSDKNVVLIAHSNGNRVIVRMLEMFESLRMLEWHAIAAWCSSDCRKNGMNAGALSGALSRVQIYVSPEDEILGLGAIEAGEPEGCLGKVGAKLIGDALDEIMAVPVVREYAHCGWINDHLEETLRIVCGVTE